MIIVKKISY